MESTWYRAADFLSSQEKHVYDCVYMHNAKIIVGVVIFVKYSVDLCFSLCHLHLLGVSSHAWTQAKLKLGTNPQHKINVFAQKPFFFDYPNWPAVADGKSIQEPLCEQCGLCSGVTSVLVMSPSIAA